MDKSPQRTSTRQKKKKKKKNGYQILTFDVLQNEYNG